jgi:tetratricopeptide (TPR) repeat protein
MPDRALTYYEKTISFAKQSGEKSIESMAFINVANFYAANNERSAAAKCYQRALALDKDAGDTKIEGADWFNYGQFLLATAANRRLAFACFLKAEQLMKGTQGAEREAVAKAILESESALASDAAKVRRNPEAAITEALELKL